MLLNLTPFFTPYPELELDELDDEELELLDDELEELELLIELLLELLEELDELELLLLETELELDELLDELDETHPSARTFHGIQDSELELDELLLGIIALPWAHQDIFRYVLPILCNRPEERDL